MNQVFEYIHTVGFEETNLVGNVYYANHVRWQGRVRELFLKQHAPEVLQALYADLSLVTTEVHCRYHEELFAFDEVLIRMNCQEMTTGRVTMGFEYLRNKQLIAEGWQQIASMRERNGRAEPCALPAELQEAMQPFIR